MDLDNVNIVANLECLVGECYNYFCSDVNICSTVYYQKSPFLREGTMWPFTQWYNGFVVMLFNHDYAFAMLWIVVIKVIEELSVQASANFGYNFRLKSRWDPGATNWDIIVSAIGILSAYWVIRLTGSPRQIRWPYQDIQRIERESNVKVTSKCKKNDTEEMKFCSLGYKPPEFEWHNVKYFVETIIIQTLPSIPFYFFSSDKIFGTDDSIDTQCFRVDWLVYFLTQILMIVMCYSVNYTSQLEIYAIWRKDNFRYNVYHGIWFLVFFSFIVPGICMFDWPRMVVMVSMFLILILLSFLTLLFVYLGPDRLWKPAGSHWIGMSKSVL